MVRPHRSEAFVASNRRLQPARWQPGEQIGARSERKILGKLGGQIALNLLIIAGVFIAAVFLHKANRDLVARLPRRGGWNEGGHLAGRHCW